MPRSSHSVVYTKSLRPVVQLEPRNVRKISGITCHQDRLLFEDNRRDAEIIRTDAAVLSPQLAIAANPWKVEWQELNASGKLHSLLECLIRLSQLLIIACLPDLGVPPPEHFFYSDDRL